MNLKVHIIILFVCWLGSSSAFGQLNAPEMIFPDSFSMYPVHGILLEEDYFVGGAVSSCKEAMIWKLDDDMNIVQQRSLRKDFYEISEVIDMKVRDTFIEVLTRQMQYEDVGGGDEGLLWFSLNTDLQVLDSMYVHLPGKDIFDGWMADSTWVIHTLNDRLFWISPEEEQTFHEIPFHGDKKNIFHSDSIFLLWEDENLYKLGADLAADTMIFTANILDAAIDSDTIYVLTQNQLWLLESDNPRNILDSVQVPDGSKNILLHPWISSLIVFTDINTVHFYDNTLQKTDEVQLFYDVLYEENLRYYPLDDGSILRMGTTFIKFDTSYSLLNGQEFGLIHRFDQNYSEANFERSDLSLKNLTLIDPYYDSEGKEVTEDTVYIITKDQPSKLMWEISNAGLQPIQSGMVASNLLWGFNCASGSNSYFFTDSSLVTDGTISGEFLVYENTDFPDGWEANRLLYTAHPNGHYDADFSDNLRSFTLRYIISSSRSSLDPDLIKVWPNPATEYIHISSSADFSFKEVEFLDFHGKVITTQALTLSNSRIRIPSGIPTGMYYLRFQTDHNSLVKKVAVLR